MESGMAAACKGKPADAAVPGNNRSERFLAPRWGASRFGLGTQGGAREAGLPWAGMLRTFGAAWSGPEFLELHRACGSLILHSACPAPGSLKG
jgi:hypothetical protein